MTESAENQVLKNILLDAAAREFDEALSEKEPVIVSRRFERQMRLMLSDPKKWAKKQHRSLWMKCLQRVAVILLICSVTIGSIMAVSPTARAAIIRWVTEWYESSVIYRFFGEPTFAELPRYEIAKLPVGFNELDPPMQIPNDVEILYGNSDGEVIRFEYMRMEQGTALFVDTSSADAFEIEVNGFWGHMYISNDPKQSNMIVWHDDQANLQFLIDGFFDSDQLMEMAESVVNIG